MAKTAVKLMRASIFILLKGLPFFTSTPSFLALPFALSTLLVASPASSSHLFSFVYAHAASLFVGVGIHPVLAAKLSQTILLSLLVSPFSLSFLLLAKASVIRALGCHHGDELSSRDVPFKPLLITHLCSILLVLASNAACFGLLVVFLNCGKFFGLPPHGTLVIGAVLAVVYSIVLANAYVVCNLSLIVSGLERRGGFSSIHKAWALIQGRTATALSLSLPINAALAATEALFQYRVMKAYRLSVAPIPCILLEAMLVAYMYAVLIVLETIIGTLFLKST